MNSTLKLSLPLHSSRMVWCLVSRCLVDFSTWLSSSYLFSTSLSQGLYCIWRLATGTVEHVVHVFRSALKTHTQTLTHSLTHTHTHTHTYIHTYAIHMHAHTHAFLMQVTYELGGEGVAGTVRKFIRDAFAYWRQLCTNIYRPIYHSTTPPQPHWSYPTHSPSLTLSLPHPHCLPLTLTGLITPPHPHTLCY